MCNKHSFFNLLSHTFFALFKNPLWGLLCCVVLSAELGQFLISLYYSTKYDCNDNKELSYPILSYVFVPEKMWTEHRAHIDTGWEQNLACGLKWHKKEDTYTKKHRCSSDHHKQKTVNILKMHAI